MDLSLLPTELWIRLLSELGFPDIWALRVISREFRGLAREALSEKLRRQDYIVRIGWSNGLEMDNVVELRFLLFDGTRFVFKPAPDASCSFVPPPEIGNDTCVDETGSKWLRDFGPKSLLDSGLGAKLPISRAWCLLPCEEPEGMKWSEDLRYWPPACLRSYPAAEDYVLDITRDKMEVTVEGLTATSSFIMPHLLDPSWTSGILRKKAPLYDEELLAFVRHRASLLNLKNSDPVIEDIALRIWLARAGAGLRDDAMLDALLSRWALLKRKQKEIIELSIRGGIPFKKAGAMSESYLLEWIQACRRRGGRKDEDQCVGVRLNMTWQRRKLHLVHILSAGGKARGDEIRKTLDGILPD
jgi:hypothetical protein